MVLSTPLPASPALENRARCPGGVSTLKGRYQSVLCDGRDAHLQMYITGGGGKSDGGHCGRFFRETSLEKFRSAHVGFGLGAS